MSKNINRGLVEFKITKINKNSNIADHKLFKVFIPKIYAPDTTVQDSLHCVLIEDMRNYVPLALNHDSIRKQCFDSDVSLVHLRSSASQHIVTSDFEFEIIKVTNVEDYAHFAQLVEEIDDHEDNIFKLTVATLSTNLESIIQNAKKRSEQAGNKPLTFIDPRKTTPVIATINFSASFLPEPITFDFLLDQSLSDGLDAQKSKELFVSWFGDFYNCKINSWTSNAASASTNHSTRVTFAHQALDLQNLYTTVSLSEGLLNTVNRVVLPRLEREISNDEHAALIKSISKILYRSNTDKFMEVFTAWQKHCGTIHKDGVIH